MKKYLLLLLVSFSFVANAQTAKKWTEKSQGGGITEWTETADGGYDYITKDPCFSIYCKNGATRCLFCHGTGRKYDYILQMIVLCEYCRGNGVVKCLICGGTGINVMRGHLNPDGTGWYYLDGEIRYFDGSPLNNEFENNEINRSTNERDCQFCAGTGKCGWGVMSRPFSDTNSLFCNGSGKCGKCLGNGFIDGHRCTRCNGSGICPECNGRKYCQHCNGTGKSH